MANDNVRSWANRGKAATADIPLTKQDKVDRGTRYEGIVEAFTPVSFSTGSLGIKIKYSVKGLERAVYENIVLKTLDKDGNLKATTYGDSNLKRRLQAFGLSAEQILAFPVPKTPKDESEAYNFQGTPVTLYLSDREYMGKTHKDVRYVFPID